MNIADIYSASGVFELQDAPKIQLKAVTATNYLTKVGLIKRFAKDYASAEVRVDEAKLALVEDLMGADSITWNATRKLVKQELANPHQSLFVLAEHKSYEEIVRQAADADEAAATYHALPSSKILGVGQIVRNVIFNDKKSKQCGIATVANLAMLPTIDVNRKTAAVDLLLGAIDNPEESDRILLAHEPGITIPLHVMPEDLRESYARLSIFPQADSK